MGEMLKEHTHTWQINKAWGPNTLYKDYVQQNCIINTKPTERIDVSYSTTRRNFVVIQSLSRVQLFVTPWTAAHRSSLSFTVSQSLLKLMSIESVIPSNHLILCHPLLLLPSILPSVGVFSSESALCIRWPKYWSFSFSLSNEYSGLISFRIDQLDLLVAQGTLKNLLQHNQKASSGLSLLYGPTLISVHWLLEKPQL